MPSQHELESFCQVSLMRPEGARGRRLSESVTAFADVETILWLHYGVELGFFPAEGAMATLRVERERFFHALEVARNSTLWRSLRPGVRSFLENAWPAFRANDEDLLGSLLATRYTDESLRDLLSPLAIGMLFHEIARAHADVSFLLLSDLMTFALDQEWGTVIAEDINPDRLSMNSGSIPDAACAGYFFALDHMGALSELIGYSADESRGEHPAPRESQLDHTFMKLGDRVRSIHLWRLNLEDHAIKDRFLDLTYKVQGELADDPELNSARFDSGAFLGRVESLCADWLGNDSISLRRNRAA
jgi:hypothetical protein